ncbi:oxidoreductase [Aureococcus anophagefferens]|nr:oxidoreductase [Aureococcus anophagefferens]
MAMKLALLAVVAAAKDVPMVDIGKDAKGAAVALPLVGAGTWEYNNSVAYESLCSAFKAGYTMLDTANIYGNEAGVGRAIKDCWTRPRSELFVMTKVPGGLNFTATLAAHEDNMKLLQLDYVDHLMTHFPSNFDGSHASKADRQTTWKALEKIYVGRGAEHRREPLLREAHRDVMEIAKVTPSINQVEYHVGSGDVDDVIPTCEKYGIHFMSFSPLCGPCNNTAGDNLITGDLVSKVAAHYDGVSGAQVSLRYIVQQALEHPTPTWRSSRPRRSGADAGDCDVP